MSGGNAIGCLLTAETVDGIQIQRSHDFAHATLFAWVRQVGYYFRHAFHAIQTLGKECLGCRIVIASCSLFLGKHIISKAEILKVNGVAFKGATQLTVEQVV